MNQVHPQHFQNQHNISSMQEVSYPSVINQLQSHGTSLNNDTYSGFFSGSSLSHSEESELELLTREEIKMIKKQKISCSQSSCSICFDDYAKGDVVRNLPCGHKFHYKCMKPWFKTSSLCPLCRFDLKTYCVQKIQETKPMGNSNISHSPSHVSGLDEHSQFAQANTHNLCLAKAQSKEQGTNTFIDFESMSMSSSLQNQLNREINGNNFVGEHEFSVFDGNNQVKNEEELKRRVLGLEARSNLSFFEKKQEEMKINFGIEDDISEIGL
jgi:hypothetical protein